MECSITANVLYMKRTGIRGGGFPSNLNSRIERKLLKLALAPFVFYL
jgi:hypothetical protein